MIPVTENPQEAAAIDICVMYRPDQPALSAQTDPADTFRDRGIDVVIPVTENPQEAAAIDICVMHRPRAV